MALAALVLVIVSISVAIVSGQELRTAIVHGALEGATTFAFAWLVLRFDLRSVPWFVATGLLLDAFGAASLRATNAGWTWFAVMAAVAVALAWYSQGWLARTQRAPQTS
jgi:hypothetical protein